MIPLRKSNFRGLLQVIREALHPSGAQTRWKTSVAVGISGGVDSSVTAQLLKREGYDVVGVFMKNWDNSDEEGVDTCPYTEDLKSAKRVCEELGIPLHTVDFVPEYWTQVFSPFLQSYSDFITPNPDAWCNRYIKFGAFRQHCLDTLGVDAIATGHYASVAEPFTEHPSLIAGIDPVKDQSYFLSLVQRRDLARVLMPLGRYRKADVRAMAKDFHLSTAGRRDSVGICFIGKRRLSDFLSNYMALTPGRFVDLEGSVVGTHTGAELYTVGQGAKISGAKWPYYVVAKHPNKVAGAAATSRAGLLNGDVLVAPGRDHEALQAKELYVLSSSMNWLDGDSPNELERNGKLPCEFKIRHQQGEFYTGTLMPCSLDPECLTLQFDAPVWAVAPGQTLAVYVTGSAGKRCVGGSIIHDAGPSLWDAHVE